MVGLCQLRPHALRQERTYSITSSAWARVAVLLSLAPTAHAAVHAATITSCPLSRMGAAQVGHRVGRQPALPTRRLRMVVRRA